MDDATDETGPSCQFWHNSRLAPWAANALLYWLLVIAALCAPYEMLKEGVGCNLLHALLYVKPRNYVLEANCGHRLQRVSIK